MGASTTIEDLIYGEDGEQPIRKTIDEYLEQAKNDQVRLRIEVRSKMKGTTKTQQERTFEVDPNVTDSDAVMRNLDRSLKDSPGEDFTGQIRINFSQAGNSQRYGSFTRNVRAAYERAPDPMGIPGELDDEMDGDNTLGDLQGPPGPMGQMNMGMFGMPPAQQGPVDQEAFRQWLDTSMNFTFRALAQNMAMFERSMQMVESLHFGLARPIEPGIVEQRGGGGGESNSGLLGMLLNTAAQLAKAETPGDAVAAAAQIATGAQPDPGAARTAAMQAAGKAVRQLTTGGKPASRAGSSYQRATEQYEEEIEAEDFPIDGDEEEEPEGGGEVDFATMDAEQVKNGFLEWVRADPSRKAEVMKMLPELSKEIM